MLNFKPFDEDLYSLYSPAEKIVCEHLYIHKHKVVKNTDKYGIDLTVKNQLQAIVGGIEVEWHGKYWKDKFPFDTVHFLYRKKKYGLKNCFYIMTNESGDSALMIGFDELLEHQTKEFDNVLMRNEMMWDVPLDHCIIGYRDINYCLNSHFTPQKLSSFMKAR